MTIIWCPVPEIWCSTGKIFSHFGPIFTLLLKNQNFEKKKAWRYHQLTLVYHKLQSYDVWFLRYKVQGTEFSVDYFLPLWPPPPKNLENQNFDKMKKKKKQFLEMLSFVPLLHKWKSYDVWVLIYGVWQTEFLLTLDHFLPFYSPINPKNNNFDKICLKHCKIFE